MQHDSHQPQLPRMPIDVVAAPLRRFMHVEAAGGVVLLACTAIALWLANLTSADAYLAFWKTPVNLTVGSFELRGGLYHWINDGLMAIFFFVVGLEIKREVVSGELRDPRQAALPI